MPSPVVPHRSWQALVLALVLFAAGFAAANRYQLAHGVLYRAAANDWASAAGNFFWLGIQALALAAAIALLGRRLFVLAMVLAFSSIVVNLGYGHTLAEVIDAGKLSWMLIEARQAGNAAGEFTGPLLLAALQAAAAIGLFAAARHCARRGGWTVHGARAAGAGGALLLLPSLIAAFGAPAVAAERNLYSLGLEVALAEPPPSRRPVDLQPDLAGTPRHVVWLVDESVAFRSFQEIVAPRLADIPHIDFGITASLGHCSAPSNLALRSGVNVRRADPALDLRRTPSIWAYARKAGYRTVLIDGQTRGVPQNLLLPPERALIDEVAAAAGPLDADVQIADRINRQLKQRERTFTYAVLRGVHFQYRDHYPSGLIPADSPPWRHYAAALDYSKARFFARLLQGVNREEVAIVYTSDHGQNLEPGAIPHCSPEPAASELHVPLIVFLPDRLAARYRGAKKSEHSASQIFPATLTWMGYDAAAVERRYDNDLSGAPARYVHFDRNVVPLHSEDPIGVRVGDIFPR